MADKHASHSKDGHDQPGGHHIVPTGVYFRVFWALMILLLITLFAAYFNLGPWNLPIAVSIAIAKAALVVAFFMHLAYQSKLVRMVAGSAFFWLAILFVLTLGDYFTRGWFAWTPR
jgi:cytochrome c oxidase subunit 4